MDINGNFRNKRKIIIKGCTFKITNIQLARRDLNTMRDFSMWNLSGILNIYDEPLLEAINPTHHLMVKKVISKKKFSKAAGPSGVVVEMIRAVVDTGATMIRDLAIHLRWEGPS